MKNSIYFYGIGGISMSALAKLSRHLGAKVYGSDDAESIALDALLQEGVEVQVGVNYEWIDACDVFVYTIAVGQQNEVVQYALSKNKQILERADFLSEISKNYEKVIAISGTHGKTTTTAMLGQIFITAGRNPSIHIGGESLDFDGNLRIGGRKIFITEACEFNRSMLKLSPSQSIITNIECDHMDTYQDLNDIENAFVSFAQKTSNEVIICGDCVDKKIFKNASKIITYGFKDSNDYVAKNIAHERGKFSFDCYYLGKNLGRISLNVLGKHNILNALACVAMARCNEIDFSDIFSGLTKFKGVKRRLNHIKNANKIDYFHDYAHHPTEIKATLQTLELLKNNGEYNRIIAIFQPHTYSRTRALLNDFSKCFDGADFLYILPTYPAREQYIIGGDALDIFYKINGRVPCAYLSNIYALTYDLQQNLRAGDCVVWIGAGDIISWADEYNKMLEKKSD